jgi:hypothetical protein
MSNVETSVFKALMKYPGKPLALEKTKINEFKEHIKTKIKELEKLDKRLLEPMGLESKSLNDLKIAIERASKNIIDYRNNNKTLKKDKEFLRKFYQEGEYLDYLDDLLDLGIWDDGFTNDIENKRSPLGKLFLPIQHYKGQQPIGIIQAVEQQLVHPHKNLLIKAQKLAHNIYCQFLEFFDPKGKEASEAYNNLPEDESHPEFRRPPIVQLFNGGASALLCGLPTPAFVLIDEKEANKMSGFSALPHEVGHVLAHTPQGASLIREMIHNIKNSKDLGPKKMKSSFEKYWIRWIEECFADAIAVVVIEEAEIFSLAHLFSDEPTNKIYKSKTEDDIDEHPNRHIRILLAIEIARKLKLDKELCRHPTKQRKPITLLDKIDEEWDAIGRKLNTDYSDEKIMNLHKKWWHLKKNFVDSIEFIAKVLLYSSYNGKKLEDFFKALEKHQIKKATGEAEELRKAIISDLLDKPTSNIARNTYNI